MPTGYTAKLYDGKPQSFEDFALHCARAFGPLIHMRDDDFNAPLRPATETNFYKERLKEAKSELLKLRSLTPQECDAEALHEFDDETGYYNNLVKERKELRIRYQSMLEQVEAWKPPTPDHDGLKKFMIEQLTSSIEGDCDMKYVTVPTLKTGEQWLSNHVEFAQHDIEYYLKEQKEEEERVNYQSKWLEQLQKSLKDGKS